VNQCDKLRQFTSQATHIGHLSIYTQTPRTEFAVAVKVSGEVRGQPASATRSDKEALCHWGLDTTTMDDK